MGLKKILEDISKVKVGIIGDFCLDAYWSVDRNKSEISIETGLATNPVVMQRYSPGGAGNVANNLAAMRVGEVRCFGIAGSDPFGTHLKKIMLDVNINCENLLIQEENFNTHAYIKPFINNSESERFDLGRNSRISDENVEKLISSLDSSIEELDAVIINQQIKEGIHSSCLFRNKLQDLINKFSGRLFFLDSRDYADFYSNTLRKINTSEALAIYAGKYGNSENFNPPDVFRAGKTLFNEWNKPLFITRGAEGVSVFEKDKAFTVKPLKVPPPIDTVGAGDSMLAGITAASAAGYDSLTSSLFGNVIAGITIKKLKITGTASPEEILKEENYFNKS